MNRKGLFIVFEGIDGCGKTTQANRLADMLRAEGREVVLTAEPTGLPSGKALREALSGRVKKSECEMAAMFVMDRIAHNIDDEMGIQNLVARGVDVICDRYYYSSLAYQGHATDYAWVKAMNVGCPEIRKPDLCIYLDLLPEESLRRINAGRESLEIYENTETLTGVRKQFLSVIEDLGETDNIKIVNAADSCDNIANIIAEMVKNLF
ncbi:MAG: dTMP kinase [Clostridia bacterium]|nr:dTMP kinase [Clostridia bacterium]